MEIKSRHAPAYKHGACMQNPRLYSVWSTMMHRCYDKAREKYKDYGGRGITVCEEWHSPNNFIEWAESHGWEDGLQLDREDNNGNYTPLNCRFVTPKNNSRNRRNTKFLTVNGETRCVAEWCETIDISPYTVYWWIKTKGREYAEERIARIT